jgi:hypothetical protein
MPSLLQRYFSQRELLIQLQLKGSTEASPTKLVAVSKTRPAEDVMALYKAGQRDFGENYLQEALQKQRSLAHLDIVWHFIGPIQSNKTRDISTFFSWVHSIDRLKIAQRLSQQRASHLPPLNVCLQVNIDNEESKSGFELSVLSELIEPISALTNIRLRGLMAIPKVGENLEQQRDSFKRLAMAKDKLNKKFKLQMDTLSMGMSGDLEAAVIEGSTMVRIGTAIFGARSKNTV